MTIRFLDTNILIDHLDNIKGLEEKFYLSSKVIDELEDIKSSSRKDEATKYKCRKSVDWLNENEDRYETILYDIELLEQLQNLKIELSNDNIIIATAKRYGRSIGEEVVFVSNDKLARTIAKDNFGLHTEKWNKVEEDNYCGYKILNNQQQIADFYENKENNFELLINEYLLIEDDKGYIVDGWKWAKDGFVPVSYKGVKSSQLGDIRPNDYFQACVFDSMHNNKLTKIGGVAGTGKSLLSLGFLFQQLEKKKIDKIVIFCNMTQVRGSETLGLYKGDRDSKLLQSQIGNFLRTKLGSLEEVERLMGKFKSMLPSNKGEYDEVLNIYPMCDIRGVDLTGQRAGVLITEAQNVTVDLMKLCIQRLGDDSIMVIEGDENTQLDSWMYEGSNNGLRRVSEVFRNEDCYGEVKLNTIYRSKLANIAERM